MSTVTSKNYIVFTIMLGIISSILLIYSVFGQSWGISYLMGLLLIATGLYPLIRLIVYKVEPFELINLFCFWFVLSMGVRGIADLQIESIWLSSYDINSDHYKDTLLLVFSYAIIALLALYLGYWSRIGITVANKLPRVSIFPKSRINLRVITLFALFVGIVANYLFLMEIGGIEVMHDSAPVIEEGIRSGGRLYYSLFLDFAIIGFLFLYISTIEKSRGITEKILLLLFAGLIGFNFLILPFKGNIIGFLIFLLVIHHYLKGRLSLKKLTVAFFSLLLILPLLNNYRRFGIGSLGQAWDDYLGVFNNLGVFSDLTLRRSAGADMFFLILDKTPDINPFKYGETLTKIFTSFIPRFLWSEKPWSFGKDFSTEYLDIPMLASVSPSTIGELYVNFHIIGIILGFFIIGIFLKVVYSYCINQKTLTKEGVIIYAIIVEKIMVLVDGPIADFIIFIAIRLFPLVVIGLLVIILESSGDRKKISDLSEVNQN